MKKEKSEKVMFRNFTEKYEKLLGNLCNYHDNNLVKYVATHVMTSFVIDSLSDTSPSSMIA